LAGKNFVPALELHRQVAQPYDSMVIEQMSWLDDERYSSMLE
jgi:hypothetical protein